MEVVKVVIVDDEKSAVESLRLMFQLYSKDVEVVATAYSVEDAVQVIRESKPDVVFLDIQMPDGTGFEVLERLNNREFEVVFVTAYSEYEIKSLKYNAIEFIQKPVRKDDLTTAVNKVKTFRGIAKESSRQYNFLFDDLNEVLPSKICLITNEAFLYKNVDEISGFEVVDNHVKVYFVDGEIIETVKTIDHFDDILSDRGFYRISQTLLVCQSKVVHVDHNKLILRGGRRVEVQASNISDFKIFAGFGLS